MPVGMRRCVVSIGNCDMDLIASLHHGTRACKGLASSYELIAPRVLNLTPDTHGINISSMLTWRLARNNEGESSVPRLHGCVHVRHDHLNVPIRLPASHWHASPDLWAWGGAFRGKACDHTPVPRRLMV